MEAPVPSAVDDPRTKILTGGCEHSEHLELWLKKQSVLNKNRQNKILILNACQIRDQDIYFLKKIVGRCKKFRIWLLFGFYLFFNLQFALKINFFFGFSP